MQSDTISLTNISTSSEQTFVFFTFDQVSKFTWQAIPFTEASPLSVFPPISDAFLMMLASEVVLRRDWDTPEEDEAWANL